MKTTKLLLLAHVAAWGLLMIQTGCTKDPETTIVEPPPPPPPPPPPVVITPPNVSAGPDIHIIFPVDSCILSAVVTTTGSKMKTYLWEKTSGPAAYKIDHPDSLTTPVRGLQTGTYIFQLTATDSSGLTGNASVVVSAVKNTHPAVSAGADKYVYLPADFASIFATATDAENNIDTYKWRQISGPAQAIIQTPDTISTKISQLKKGAYSFELTVTDKGSLSGKDTVNVMVFDPADVGTNQKTFKDLQWDCGWGGEGGCWLLIDNIFSDIPRNVPIKVFIKTAGSSTWTEVSHESLWTAAANMPYVFGFGDDTFYVYPIDESKKWEVMVVY